MPADGFDCSGFVRFVLTQAGLRVPDYITARGERRAIRHANEFFDSYGITVHEPYRLPGDLIFFSRNGRKPTHVGIVGPDDADHFIHAPGRDDTEVVVSAIARAAIVFTDTESRQIYFENPIGYKTPTVELDTPSYRWHHRPV